MEPRPGDESRLKRQQALARRMAEALDRVNRERGGMQDPHECPDTEIIAAYAEQALDPVESGKWEGHFAACARCRNILRVLSVSADTPLAEKEVAHIGELVSSAASARQPVTIPAASVERQRPQPVDWRVRWFAPAMAVAAVLLVWFSVRPPWRTTEQGSTTTLVAQAPRQEIPQNPPPSGADQSVQVAPQQNEKVQAMPPAAATSEPLPPAPANQSESPAKRKSGATGALDSIAPDSNVVASARGDAAKDEKKLGRMAEPRQNEAQALGMPSAAPPPPVPQMRAPSPAPAAPPAEAKSSTSPSAASAPSVQTESAAISQQNAPAADKQAGALQPQAGAASATAAQQEELSLNGRSIARKEQSFAVARSQQRDTASLLKAPSGLIHYRAGRAGMIERSVDAGKTWTRQLSPLKEDWLAASSPTDAVCWLAGRHGAIARTVDGQHWERVAPPAQAAASDGSMPDWIGISVADSQTAGITAADGRRFATGDGGKTWQSQ